ncbi:hypothetical protein PFICI_04058 [Pestalotiopsis fici W106-1]|uniref:NACHT domain-containing protein n=1 Tax=Pestalotiopsis fici (strain W106-1 / CGMCC3.15140) TaxID=1229662 RepID=W3XIZ0_PESFW|nr:uncharacterized protein PFICI_04058 [Pestalotiopsis fici W106-1]ETS86033.1 hypothetical protein PFICI_04058 [Pestalotiopsis fici W106-1]
MRLLKVGSQGELLFTKDLIHGKDEIPPYAILSHTWGSDPDDEVTFKDLKKQRGIQKASYEKILFCAEQAKCDDLNHFWVDTCCIDKTNAVELTESINSMFRWYQQAERCYAFLSDVSCSREQDNHSSQLAWQQQFKSSRWFTRGWTLQELIAPSVVQFFSSDKRFLGDKNSLRQEIHEVTGIPIGALLQTPLSSFSVDERISWATSRTTSKMEDKAYSLLGILSISMPVIYGEGEREAFNRLRIEISRRSVLKMECDEVIGQSRTGILGPSILAQVLARLPVAKGAAFDSYSSQHDPLCHPDTRTKVIQDISEWARDTQSKPIYWLNGMAGTGKSTILRTLADLFSRNHHLGATFFFRRGQSDRTDMGKFFTTLASHLAQNLPGMAFHIKAALDEDPEITSKAMRQQFERLILDPCSELPADFSPGRTSLVIIDALDECERVEDVRVLIRLLSTINSSRGLRLKFFLTSRPELPIRLGFKAAHGTYQTLVLHDIDHSAIKNDIATYLKHELCEIRKHFNKNADQDDQLSRDWPRSSDLEILVQMAIPLFISAATISRFIADGRVGSPDNQLREVLKHQRRSQESHLDTVYLPVLHQMVTGLNPMARERVLIRFHKVVGSIVTLASPLSPIALAELLCLSLSEITTALQTLHSVLNVPSTHDQVIQPLHSSFRDFLVNAERRRESFWIDEKEVNRHLATQCLRVLNTSLKNDIANVRAPDAEAFPTLSVRLSSEVQYACRYWTLHLCESAYIGREEEAILREFLSSHFLQWLEAMSWMRRYWESRHMFRALRSVITSHNFEWTADLVEECIEFIEDMGPGIEVAPLQVYSSALVFSPYRSIRELYQKECPSWVELKPRSSTYWSEGKSILDKHIHGVRLMDFSSDGMQLASVGSDDSIVIWSVATGHQVAILNDPIQTVSTYMVKFSPDGKEIALASEKGTITIWSTTTGSQKVRIEGHGHYISSIAFSPDGEKILSTSLDESIIIWSTMTGERQGTITGLVDVGSATFSLDGKRVMFKSSQVTHIWFFETNSKCPLVRSGQKLSASYEADLLSSQETIYAIPSRSDSSNGFCLARFHRDIKYSC